MRNEKRWSKGGWDTNGIARKEKPREKQKEQSNGEADNMAARRET